LPGGPSQGDDLADTDRQPFSQSVAHFFSFTHTNQEPQSDANGEPQSDIDGEQQPVAVTVTFSLADRLPHTDRNVLV
jgi:hypothetical protein